MSKKFSQYQVEESSKLSKQQQEDVTKLYNKYKDYSSSQLLDEFIKVTQQKKQDGSLNKDEILALKQTLMPMLNASQQATLNSLMDMVL